MGSSMFSLTITNNNNGGTISTDTASGYDGWRIPSDGLDGFGSMPFSTGQAERQGDYGGIVLGAHSGVRQLGITLESPPTEAKRDEAYKTFAVGSSVTLTVSYIRSGARTIDGVVTACKVSEGNIYEPTTVTATIDCVEPTFAGSLVHDGSPTPSIVGDTATVKWELAPVGDFLAKFNACLIQFTTGNTETVTLTKQATLTLTIKRFPTFAPFALPDETALVWSVGPVVGKTVSASTAIIAKVDWSGDEPIAVYNDSKSTINYANLPLCKGLSSKCIAGGANCSVALSLELDSQILPSDNTAILGELTYYSTWQGV